MSRPRCHYAAEIGMWLHCRPPLWRRMANFARSLARHAAAGFPITPAARKAARLAACRACPKLRPDGSCGSCGCVVEVKAAWDRESCPDGRWPA